MTFQTMAGRRHALGPKGKIKLCKKSVFHCIQINGYFALNCGTFVLKNYLKVR